MATPPADLLGRLNVSYDQIRSVRRRQAITISSCFCRHHNDNDNREQHFKFVHLMMWCARLYVACVCCFSQCVFCRGYCCCRVRAVCLLLFLLLLFVLHTFVFTLGTCALVRSLRCTCTQINKQWTSIKEQQPNTVNKPRCSIELNDFSECRE